MKTIYLVFFIFLGLILYKAIFNFFHWVELKVLFGKYIKSFENDSYLDIVSENKLHIIDLIKKTGVPDSHVSIVQPLGFGKISTSSVSVLQNLENHREDIVGLNYQKFNNAIGEYKRRALESINPLFWISSIINLPRLSFEYLGVKPESVIIKIFQLIWWIIALVFFMLKVFFQSLLNNWIATWFR